MKNIVVKSALFVIVSSITFTLNAQTKKSQTNISSTSTVEVEQVQPTNSGVVVESPKSPHGHLLMKEIPSVNKSNSIESKQSGAGIRGNEIIGEGQYLNYDKVIMERMVDGQIPANFPKHVIGQTPEDYKVVVMNWARNNTHLIKQEYHHEIK